MGLPVMNPMDDYGIVNDILVHVYVHSSLSDLVYYILIAFHYELSPC